MSWRDFVTWASRLLQTTPPPTPYSRPLPPSTLQSPISDPLMKDMNDYLASIGIGTFLKPSTGLLEIERTPSVWKLAHGITASGPATIWTPAQGKTIRLIHAQITLAADSTTAAALNIGLQELGTSIWNVDVSSLALVKPVTPVIWELDFKNGYLFSAANNPLTLVIAGGGALTAGALSVNCWGTEE